jgi:predicted RNase H-like nuclease
MTTFVAGADGCPPGWVVVLKDVAGRRPPEVMVCANMAQLLVKPELPGIIAVDMPIGLPDSVGPGGRGPEAELRGKLGGRQSSVFAIPSRSAVYADEMIRADPGLALILRESHPEGAFMVMNGEQPLDEPKKVKSAVHEPGIALRKRLLRDVAGFPEDFLDRHPPRGVGVDDFIDACACAWVAQRVARGNAVSFPTQPERDEYGIPMAIWA